MGTGRWHKLPASITLLIACSAMGVVILVLSFAVSSTLSPVSYIGSDTCMSCHAGIYTEWHDSLHRKMMRPVSEEGAVLAELDQAIFPPEEVAWVIGSKWEQQFMGTEGGRETLLAGAWSVHDEEWLRQGWDGWQVPVPLVRCHGCHTVGLNPETGEFVEPGIGCESCHGPSSRHVATSGRSNTHTSVDAQVCGQCHARGANHDRSLFYPHGYRPGDDLDDYFHYLEPDYIQNSSQWWGTGSEQDRHQQYAAWRRGGHADSLKSLKTDYDGRFGEVTTECLSCHAGEVAIRGRPDGLTLRDVEEGITCTVCHQVHGNLEDIRMDCQSCHDNGPLHHQAITLAEHIPCPSEANVTCVDCHMPVTITIGGEYRLRSHAPGVIEPEYAAQFDAPSTCANNGCHATDSSADLQQAFNAFYRNPETEWGYASENTP